MKDLSQDFLDSLDASDRAVFPYLPYLLQDLWGLGSIPEYVLQLVQKHIPTNSLQLMVDLGCGKGETLIKLGQQLNCKGIGIDIMPAFIRSARQYADTSETRGNLQFLVGDIRDALNDYQNIDLAIYGHDSDILGDIEHTLKRIGVAVSIRGWIIFESLYSLAPGHGDYPDQEVFYDQLQASDLRLVEVIKWDREQLKQVNKANTESIKKRAQELNEKHPDLKPVFSAYVENQIRECRELEEELQCVTALLRK